jgi:2-dehydro-3-deoxyphosphogalactonate aldolase
MIETAAGVINAEALAACGDPHLAALAFGAEDFITELGGRRTPAGLEVLYARSRVVLAARAAGLASLPGVMTPSEGFAALKAGADGLKLFPAEVIPPAVFKAWRAVFPADTLLLAVGGVGIENIATYRDAGASGYGIGSALYKPGRPAAEIGGLAKALVVAAKG